MHQDTSSPSFSSRNFFLVPNSFRRAGGVHCVRQISVKFRELNLIVSFPSGGVATISPVPPLAPSSLFSLLIRAPHARLAACGRWWRWVTSTPATPEVPVASRHGHQRAAPQNGVPRTAQATRKLRVAVLSSVIIAEPSPWPGIRECALCHR